MPWYPCEIDTVQRADSLRIQSCVTCEVEYSSKCPQIPVLPILILISYLLTYSSYQQKQIFQKCDM